MKHRKVLPKDEGAAVAARAKMGSRKEMRRLLAGAHFRARVYSVGIAKIGDNSQSSKWNRPSQRNDAPPLGNVREPLRTGRIHVTNPGCDHFHCHACIHRLGGEHQHRGRINTDESIAAAEAPSFTSYYSLAPFPSEFG